MTWLLAAPAGRLNPARPVGAPSRPGTTAHCALPVHVSDHLGLLRPMTRPERGDRWMRLPRVDAIVVPSGRDARFLKHACRVARSAGRLLIVLADGACRPGPAVSWIRRYAPEVPVVVVDFDRVARSEPAHVTRLDPGLRWPKTTAAKRNAALRLARRLGLRHLLFLDDDVYGLRGSVLLRTLQQARREGWRAAGWSHHDFPDNSTVCHAYRRLPAPAFGAQSCFVGGGCLLVVLDDEVPHFPEGVYNEDWLFVQSRLAQGPVGYGGRLGQLPYDPYLRPSRPRQEEFGDVLAERMMSAVGRDRRRLRQLVLGDKDQWRHALRARRQFLDHVADGLRSSPTPHPERVVEAVTEARRALDRIEPRHFTDFTRAWKSDADRWRREWSALGGRECLFDLRTQIGRSARVDLALSDLDLRHCSTVIWLRPSIRRRMVPRWIRAYVPRSLKRLGRRRAGDSETGALPGGFPADNATPQGASIILGLLRMSLIGQVWSARKLPHPKDSSGGPEPA